MRVIELMIDKTSVDTSSVDEQRAGEGAQARARTQQRGRGGSERQVGGRQQLQEVSWWRGWEAGKQQRSFIQ